MTDQHHPKAWVRRSTLRVDLVFPALPPAHDGIGDYTARFAEALGARCHTRIWTAQPDAAPIPNVEVRDAFALWPPSAYERLHEAVKADPPDWLVLQYNPFSYGRWGLCPWLPGVLERLKRANPALRVAVMFHERYVPVINVKFAIMRMWQRWQFKALAALADLVFFSIQPWTEAHRRRHPRRHVVHLPVGSNMPCAPGPRADVRASLGVADGVFVLGLFGSAHASRLLGSVRAAVERLRRTGTEASVLYIGPDSAAIRRALGGVPLLDLGRLDPAAVSWYLGAVDLFAVPFIDGLSTRRGSMMVGLQHGLPVLGTSGEHTDDLLHDQDGAALVLTPAQDPEAFAAAAVRLAGDAGERARLGAAARQFYQAHFDWPVVAAKLLRTLEAVDAVGGRS